MNKFIHILFCIALLFSSMNSYAKPYSSPEELVSAQKTIRILAEGGIGFGDFVATVNVMSRIRQLGFQGTYDFIYLEDATDRLINLFGLPSPLPDIYEDSKRKIRFIKMNAYLQDLKQNKVPATELGITGCFWRNACKAVLSDDPNNKIANELQDTITCQNQANFTNTKIFFNLNNWVTPRTKTTAFDDDSIYFVKNFEKPFPLEDDRKTYFTFPAPSLDEAKNFLENEGKDILQKKPALKTLINLIETKKIDFMPLYGYTLTGKYNLGNMLQIISAARYAQLNGQAKNPLVIAIFNNYENEMKLLEDIILRNNWGDINEPGTEQARMVLEKLTIKNIFSAASLADSKTLSQLENLKPGEILFLSMGSLPKVVFDGVYVHTDENIWPQIREGASSFSSLLLTGKPHFRCGGDTAANEGGVWEISFANIQDQQLKSRLENFYSIEPIFCSGFAGWLQNAERYQQLGDLLIDAQSPTSALSRYFVDLKIDASKKENDRVWRALLQATHIK